jgi:hypothetical protein
LPWERGIAMWREERRAVVPGVLGAGDFFDGLDRRNRARLPLQSVGKPARRVRSCHWKTHLIGGIFN